MPHFQTPAEGEEKHSVQVRYGAPNNKLSKVQVYNLIYTKNT